MSGLFVYKDYLFNPEKEKGEVFYRYYTPVP